jgi:hypothetical protein
MKDLVENILNQFPEVVWDRFTGDLVPTGRIAVYGWIARPDGRSDFLWLGIDTEGAYMMFTSSAKYSAEFYRRLQFNSESGHIACKRVADFFHNVRTTRTQ